MRLKLNLASVKDAPAHFEYAPAGRHEIEATVNGEPGSVEIEIRPEDAARLDKQLQDALAAAERGSQSRPFIDFDHGGGAAAAIPKRFFWDGGLRLEVDWTRAGKEAIEGREYSYFSPEIIVNRESGLIEGLPESGPIGGLVNTPAFQRIERLAARETKTTETTENRKMEDNTKELLKEHKEKAARLEAENAALKAGSAALEKSNADLAAENARLKESEKGLAGKVEAARKEKIENTVDGLAAAGRILKESRDGLVAAALGLEDDGKSIFDALPQAKASKRNPDGSVGPASGQDEDADQDSVAVQYSKIPAGAERTAFFREHKKEILRASRV